MGYWVSYFQANMTNQQWPPAKKLRFVAEMPDCRAFNSPSKYHTKRAHDTRIRTSPRWPPRACNRQMLCRKGMVLCDWTALLKSDDKSPQDRLRAVNLQSTKPKPQSAARTMTRPTPLLRSKFLICSQVPPQWVSVYPSIYIYLYLSISIYLTKTIYNIYLSISIYIYPYVSISTCIYLYLSISNYIDLYLSISSYTCLCLSISISTYIYLGRVCVCIYIYFYISIYVYTRRGHGVEGCFGTVPRSNFRGQTDSIILWQGAPCGQIPCYASLDKNLFLSALWQGVSGREASAAKDWAQRPHSGTACCKVPARKKRRPHSGKAQVASTASAHWQGLPKGVQS